MKKTLLLAFIFMPFILFAQSQSSIGLYAGATFPMSPSDFKSYWKTSFSIGGDYSQKVGNVFYLGGELNYSSFSLDNSSLGVSSSVTGGAFNALQILGFVKLQDENSAGMIAPFGKVGLGLSSSSASDLKVSGTTIATGTSETGLGISLAAGLDYKLAAGNKLSLELSYRMNNRKSDSYNGIIFALGYRFKI
ncbi:MAG: outer membrane beta-barrel protein [Bacteroidetes bacterium]|nr:outer membrane beta-barrel protein [Bacteroidota bacterium]